MPISLLPASAAAFAPRSGPQIVLNSKVEPWLTQTLKRINRVKRPLNSVPQHFRCLTETLSGPNAIWTLCSIMLPKAPESELTKDTNPLVEALFNYQLLHVEAYVVHVDMVSQHEVAFKLTSETIDNLVEYHKDIYSVDVSASTWPWAEKEAQLKKLQEEFVQSVNKFVFRCSVRALEGLEEDGAGELLDGRSDDVKSAIIGLFLPLLPPPPRIVDVVRPAALLPSSSPANASPYWHPSQHVAPAHHAVIHHQPQPVESWKVLPSTPSPTLASCTSEPPQSFWSTMDGLQLPSPTPSYSQPFAGTAVTTSYYSPPHVTATMAPLPVSSAADIMQHCGTSMGGPGFGAFDWSNTTFAPAYATVM